MAIYSFNRKITNRVGKNGQIANAVFASAYYRAEKRTCSTSQETKDFSSKQSEVVFKTCMLPDNAPDWAQRVMISPNQEDKSFAVFSEYAWNFIEQIEKRKDAQLYIRDIAAIPKELNIEQSVDLAKSFARDFLAVDGVFCDVAIHWMKGNPHVHFMHPCFRKMTDEGFSKKERITPAELQTILLDHRKGWADYCNHALRLAGFDIAIDHRSYKERCLDLTPMKKVGKVTHMHGSEIQALKVAENQYIQASNYQKIQQNPDILAQKMGQERQSFHVQDVSDEVGRFVVGEQVLARLNQEDDASREKIVADIISVLKEEYSIFSDKQLKLEALKHAPNQVEFQAIIQGILSSDKLYHLGLGEDGREQYIAKEMFKHELDLIESAESLNVRSSFLVDNQEVRAAAEKYQLNEGQQRALVHITQGADIALVRGMAGTGKTYLLKPAFTIWQKAGFRVHGVAFLGRAAAALEHDSGIPSRTIDSFLTAVAHGSLTLGHRDIIVMDEKGMVSLDHMHAIVKITKVSGAKFVALGDVEQTQAIARGAAAKALTDTIGCVVLDDIIRQKTAWQAQATQDMELSHTMDAFDAYRDHQCISWAEDVTSAIDTTVANWAQQLSMEPSPLKEHIMVAFKNETVAALNHAARAHLVKSGKIETGQAFATISGTIKLAVGDRIIFGRGDNTLGVKNGHFGMIDAINHHTLKVKLDDGSYRQVDTKAYQYINYGYAATIHKLQGYTGNHVSHYIDSRNYNRHLFLVGASRHRLSHHMVIDKATFKDEADVKDIICRDGLKDHILDFPVSFAIRRNLDQQSVSGRAVSFLSQLKTCVQNSMQWLFSFQDTMQAPSSEQADPMMERRQQAVMVADFCDRREAVGALVEQIKHMPGYELSIHYQTKPQDEDVLARQLYLYADEQQVWIAARSDDGKLHRFDIGALLDAKVLKSVRYTLQDTDQIEPLLKVDRNAIISAAEQHGFALKNQKKIISLRQQSYQLRLANSEVAAQIASHFDQLHVAMNRNRVSRESVDRSVAFGERHRAMQQMVAAYRTQQFYNPPLANDIISNLSDYYGHIIAAIGSKKELGQCIQDLKHQAHQHRFEQALTWNETSHAATITVKRYLDLDDEIVNIQKYPHSVADEIKAQLHNLLIERNQLAQQIGQDADSYTKICDHFGVEERRRLGHQRLHEARERVLAFALEAPSSKHSQNLRRQLLAEHIQNRYRIHAPFVRELLPHGRKDIDIEYFEHDNEHFVSNTGLASRHDATGTYQINDASRENQFASRLADHQLYYHEAQPIAYTPAEHYLCAVNGLVGVNLSMVRYHPEVMLHDHDQKMPAMILPAINAKGVIQAEMIFFLNQQADAVVATTVRGDTKGAIVAVQQKSDSHQYYLTDNLLDAAALAVGKAGANIYLHLDHYQHLDEVAWILQPSDGRQASLFLSTDHFTEENEHELYRLASPLRHNGLSLSATKGHVEGPFSHISIHEALLHQANADGNAYIRHHGLKAPVKEKRSIKGSIKRIFSSKEPVAAAKIIRPHQAKAKDYYWTISAQQKASIDAYLVSIDQLKLEDTVDAAIHVAQAASAVYDHFEEALKAIRQHPQADRRLGDGLSFEAIYQRVQSGQPLRLPDVQAMLEHVAKPQVDSATITLMSSMVDMMQAHPTNPAYLKHATQFIEERQPLVDAWRQNKHMPSEKFGISLAEVAATPVNDMDRHQFFTIARFIKKDVAHHTHKKNLSHAINDETTWKR